MTISSKRSRRRKVLHIITAVFIAVTAIIFVLPTILTIVNAFMTSNELNANYGLMFENLSGNPEKTTYISSNLNLKLIPDKVSFNQFKTILFTDPDYLLKFWNSVILVVPITLFQVLLAIFTAYGFSRHSGRLKELIFFTYIILLIMPYQVTLVPNYLVAEKLHLLNTRWAVILPGIFSPFAVFLITKVMKRIPISYIEAAKLDGATEFQLLRHICTPLSKGAIVSVTLLIFIDYWNMVELPLILMPDAGSMHPLSVFLAQINTKDIGIAFSIALIYMLPTLLMFLYGEDFLVEGITYAGGIKG